MDMDISQEPFYVRILGRNAAAQSRSRNSHGHGSQMEHPDQAPALNGLNSHRAPLSVDTLFGEQPIDSCAIL